MRVAEATCEGEREDGESSTMGRFIFTKCAYDDIIKGDKIYEACLLYLRRKT
jgi:hypothetical protein